MAGGTSQSGSRQGLARSPLCLSVCSFLFLLSGPPSFHLSPLRLRAEQAICCFLPFFSSPGSI